MRTFPEFINRKSLNIIIYVCIILYSGVERDYEYTRRVNVHRADGVLPLYVFPARSSITNEKMLINY